MHELFKRDSLSRLGLSALPGTDSTELSQPESEMVLWYMDFFLGSGDGDADFHVYPLESWANIFEWQDKKNAGDEPPDVREPGCFSCARYCAVPNL